MAEERDIWESARNMIERYGPDALRQVRLRIQELGEYGQPDARRHWLRIENAVKVLRDEEQQEETLMVPAVASALGFFCTGSSLAISGSAGGWSVRLRRENIAMPMGQA